VIPEVPQAFPAITVGIANAMTTVARKAVVSFMMIVVMQKAAVREAAGVDEIGHRRRCTGRYTYFLPLFFFIIIDGKFDLSPPRPA
jgi:hypothetical protein